VYVPGSVFLFLFLLFTEKVFHKSPDFRPRAQLWLIQTTILIIVYGKMCSPAREDHEMVIDIYWIRSRYLTRADLDILGIGACPVGKLSDAL
jgi:hypothetical protein